MINEEGASSRGRGRPPRTDRTKISALAFRLFEKSGFAETTMADIAAEAGISYPTLFRYFPSKASILWDSYSDSVGRFREMLADEPSDSAVLDAVFSAYARMLVAQRGNLALIKSRISLVSKESGDVAAAWDRYEEWGAIVVDFVAARRGVEPSRLEAVLGGGMIWSGLWAAIVHWSHGDELDPGPTLDRAKALISRPVSDW